MRSDWHSFTEGRDDAIDFSPALRCNVLRRTLSATRRSLVFDWSRRALRAMTVWRLSSGVAPSKTKTGLMLSVSSRMTRLRQGHGGQRKAHSRHSRGGDTYRKNPIMCAFFIIFPASNQFTVGNQCCPAPYALAGRGKRRATAAPSSSRIAFMNCVIQIDASTA